MRKYALLLLASAALLSAADPDAKIDRGLITQLLNSEDGTGSFFVQFGDRTPLAAASRIPNWVQRGQAVVTALQTTANRSQAGVRGYLQAQGFAFTPYWVVNAVYVPHGTLELARDLSRRPEVAAIVPESIRSVPPATAGSTLSVGWNLSMIGADQVWATYSNRGTGMVVANIDTGVQYTHPALVSQYRGNLGGGNFSHDGNWFDPAKICGAAPCDNNGHGTHTMGTMVGDDGAGNQVGVAPGAKWIACKGCESNSCSSSSLISCAQWVMAPGGDASKRPNAVNNSWGGGNGDSWYQSYVQNWVSSGIFPAFSAGNSGPACGSANSPGDYPESFASGAVDSLQNIASFSSRGPSAFGGIKPNLSAPGVGIVSSYPTNSYASLSGTSMASPHTAASAALLWAVRPSLIGNIAGTESLLTANAAPRGTTETCGGIAAGAVPNDTFGYGRLDIKKAVDAGGGPVNQPPTVTIRTPSGDGQQFDCGTPVTFAATASDPENGDLTAVIQWSGPGTPASASGGSISKTFSCTTETGNRSVVAGVTDSGGLTASDTVVVNIVNPNGAPAAPSGLTASVSGNSVALQWVDNSNNEQGFYVYRRSKGGKGWSLWTKVATVTAHSFTDGSVPSGNYQYYVTAYNGFGESAGSTSVSVRVR